jgi:chorismate-pyruvate lyase
MSLSSEQRSRTLPARYSFSDAPSKKCTEPANSWSSAASLGVRNRPKRPGTETLGSSQLAGLLASYDGSVTILLSLLAGEQVQLHAISQQVTDRHGSADTAVLTRDVKLATATGPVLVDAHSTIFLDRLPDAVGANLARGAEPIGVVLRAARLELFREVVDTGWVRPPREPPLLPPSACPAFERHSLLWRNGRIALDIVERFTPACIALW